MTSEAWYTLTDNRDQLDLDLTLPAGQVFCWEFDAASNCWLGVIDDIAFRLRHTSEQSGGGVQFQYVSGSPGISRKEAESFLHAFFQLDINMPKLLEDWSNRCPVFERVVMASKLAKGLRICRQSPFECLVSFIVSANNHIKRINSNLKSIRCMYGSHIKGSESWNTPLYSFPNIQQLSSATEDELRNLGLGYRAGYIVKTCTLLKDDPDQLVTLRDSDDIESTRTFLTSLAGVGRKVADCVCLYSLDFPGISPVDTHMYQVAQRLFKHVPKDKHMHDKIQDLMIERFGEKAGWAHCFLFAADLPNFDTDWSKRARVRE